MKRVFTTILTVVMFTSCNTDKQDKGSLAHADSVVVSEINHVKTVVAQIKTFTSQIISNGKVLSLQEIPLSFQSEGLTEQITIENGSVVKSKQLLASLKNDIQKLALKEALLQLDESRVEISDQLITQGGKRGDTSSVSSQVYSYIKLRSGCKSSNQIV